MKVNLIQSIFNLNGSYKSYHHIILNSNRLTQLEKMIIDSIRKTTDFEFNQITLNRNNQLGRHRHANVGTSLAMLLGNFEGGALCIETGERFDSKNEWFSFDGSQFHWVEPFQGERFSIILYNR